MGFFDEIKKLTSPYDEDDEDMGYDTVAEDEPAPRTASPFATQPASAPQPQPTRSAGARREGKVVNINGAGGVPMQVVLVKPERFEVAAEIADHLRERRAVVMNLETTSKEISRRLIDFLSGVAYAQDGRISKVATNTYILTPSNVDLVGDLMDELGNSGMYF